MKSKIFFIAVLFLSITSMYAQDIFTTSNAKVSFHSKTPVEDIDAISNKVASVLNIKTKQIYFKIQNTSFQFKAKLMQEHFNENYAESTKFPKSEFKGNIAENANVNYTKDGVYVVKVKGQLTLHGETKEVETSGTVSVKGGSISLAATFNINLEEYKVNVPTVVGDKVSKTAKITVDCALEPLKK